MKSSKTEANVEAFRFLTITRGVVSVLFGIMALVWPGMTLATLAILFTIWLLASGVINIIKGVMSIGKGLGWILTLVIAILQIGIGAYLIQRPGLTVATFVALAAIALVVEGVVSIVLPLIEGNEVNSSEKFLTISFGILSAIAGIAIWRYPVSASLAFVWILGLFALVSGPVWIAVGIDAKNK